ncbi:MAG TPA: hypothetical protein V6D27_09000 [Vampirovibrionales bacterium]
MPDPISLLRRAKRKTLDQLRSWLGHAPSNACGPTRGAARRDRPRVVAACREGD